MQTRYICPLCRGDLFLQNKTFTCEKNHCFDIAKEGYVNLLPVQQKKSKEPGDNKVMIQCRKDFLNKQFYDLLIEPCAKIIDALISEHFDDCCLIDIGCGEGFFTRKIFGQLKQSASFHGMDISKDAVKFSAKANKSIAWAVASSNNIPLKDDSIDIILKINAPLNYAKSLNKLSNAGVVVSVTPGEAHLASLKSLIYEQPQQHQKETCPAGYTNVISKQLSQEMYLTNETDIKNLFMMTPFYWNASQANKEKINQLHHLKTPIAFDINVWSKQ